MTCCLECLATTHSKQRQPSRTTRRRPQSPSGRLLLQLQRKPPPTASASTSQQKLRRKSLRRSSAWRRPPPSACSHLASHQLHPRSLPTLKKIMHPGEQIEGKKKSSFLLHFPPCQRTLHAAGTSVAIPVPSVKTKASLRLDKSPRPSLRGVKANSVPLSRGYL